MRKTLYISRRILIASVLLIVGIILIGDASNAFAQSADTLWVRKYQGYIPSFKPQIEIYNDDIIYVAGRHAQAGSCQDMIVLSYSTDGNLFWQIEGIDIFEKCGLFKRMEIDAAGNIYLTGHMFDDIAGADIFLLKLNQAGDTVWTTTYNSGDSTYDYANDIAIDEYGNIYLTGSSGMEDDTPYDHKSTLLKFNPMGQLVWETTYLDSDNNPFRGLAVAIDGFNNLYVAGHFSSSQNFIYRTDIFLIKYSPQGDTIWSARLDDAEINSTRLSDMIVDDNGDIYLSGEFCYGETFNSDSNSSDYITLKFSTDGDLDWQRLYNGPANSDDIASGISINSAGESIVTGTSITNLDPLSDRDFATIKYNQSGDMDWISYFDHPVLHSNDNGNQIAVDDLGNIYVTGNSLNHVYPGYLFDTDIATVKYNENGDEIWRTFFSSQYYEYISYDYNPSLTIDNSGNIYVVALTDFQDTSQDEIFLIKYKQLPYLCGDINEDRMINLIDITYMIAYLFADGPAPQYLESADVNHNGEVNLADITSIIDFLYSEGIDPYCIITE